MGKSKRSKKQENKNKNGKNHHKKRLRNGGGTIEFDPEARREYLTGFSKRKQSRRVYGLAMQKVKDRKAKLEERSEMKQAMKEQLEHAEQQKEELMLSALEGSKDIVKPLTAKEQRKEKETLEIVQTYQDVQTQLQWGGEVSVTISTTIPNEDDEFSCSNNNSKKKQKQSIDAEQVYAGDVSKFISKLKGNVPGKGKNAHKQKGKGRHGASKMKGMATNAGDLKIAQKALARSSHLKVKSKGGGKKRKR